ncbi:O-antigen ligase family protein [Gelidibacter maritimus]|uniref:O-antigen ligase family protein n=1 Tax=Gelidibacter maritimus TaxID=2761487 RepID=A0A7W2M6G6_9FLAO|nr:O-antigen ligase family protein [Gelidibacter maritimus]MBA6153574.1 O-antigen ligase family protein [Gelidibacter maritimus]
MNKLIVSICFYLPFAISCLNVQEITANFVSTSLAQIIAYLNLVLIITGVVLFRKNIRILSSTNRLWFVFYILYYGIGLLASGVSGFQTSIIATLVPVIFFTGYNFLLSNKVHFNLFFIILTICFVITSFITIIFVKLNFNIYTGEVLRGWDLDRAGGITGDANAAALTNIIAFLLVNQIYKPSKIIFRLIKILLLITIFYSLFLTFSTTGLFTFTIIFALINYKFFTGIKIVLFVVMIPLFYIGVFVLQSEVQSLGLSKAQTYKIENITNLLTFKLDKVDNSGRGDLLDNVIHYLYKNPILGNGIDFSVAMRGHNTYIGIWVDAGILTFLFFIFMLSYYLLKTFALIPQLRFFAMSLLIVLYIFMISLQSVINKPYLIVIFVFIGYLIDNNKSDNSYMDTSQETI